MIPNLSEFTHLPRFPDGRINYTGCVRAPVLNCVVRYQGQVLLLQRSDKVANYKGYWNFVAGFLDYVKPLEEKALDEVTEEIGITNDDVQSVRCAEPYEVFDSNLKKTWIVHPVLVDLKRKPDVKLDWEHTNYAWILPTELSKYEVVIKLEESLKRALG